MNIPGIKVVNPNLSFRGNFQRNRPEHIIIHHALASSCTIQDIHRWHLDNGWAGCGYHFFVNKRGIVHSGRKVEWNGAHCPPLNRRSIGICLEGCYQEYKDQTDRDVPKAQLEALEVLVRFLMEKYNVPLEKVEPHSAYSQKLCPGNYFPWERFVENLKTGGEDEMEAYGVVYWSLDDMAAARRLADRMRCGTYSYFVASEKEVAKEVLVVGGDGFREDGTEIKGNYKLVSGQTIWETYRKVEAEIRSRR